jgi:hypothetical protein
VFLYLFLFLPFARLAPSKKIGAVKWRWGVALVLGKKRKRKKELLYRHVRTSARENELGGLSCLPASQTTAATQNSTQSPTRVCGPVRSKNAALGV